MIVGTIFAVITALNGNYQYNAATGSFRSSGINVIGGIVTELGVLLAGLGLLAVSQLIQLLLDLEENTRRSATSQSDQVKLLKMLVRQGQGVQRMPDKKVDADFPEF